MKKIFFSIFAFVSLSSISSHAQLTPIYNYDVQRLETYTHGTPGHAHSDAVFELKIGASSIAQSYGYHTDDTRNYNFSPSSIGPVITYSFKVSYPAASISSGYYPLPLSIGGETVIYAYDPGMYNFLGRYGFSVVVKRISSTQFTFKTTQFNSGIISASTTLKTTGGDQVQATLFPNPGNGYAHLEYNAAANDQLTVRVTDINGKFISMYRTDLQAGSNRLPVDISNAAAGTYFVYWQSASGNKGILQMIKQ
ncbi:MAG: hypothetical protein BGO31_01730 [Bacteroidetes bacterium 43-16]|nr:MAG: hypothetical protein BGO31_01730 [Bacteroidetes bacterium 43-16]